MRACTLFIPLLTGCLPLVPDDGVDCTAEAVVSVLVAVTDAAGATLPDATVRYTHDGETADCEGSFPPATWACGWERAGRVTVTADALGYEAQQVEVFVPADVCHVQTQEVTVQLVPATCPPVVRYGVEVTTVSAAGERIDATVEWLPHDGTDFTNPMPCDAFGDGTYGCAEDTGRTIEIWATAREHGSFYATVDVPFDDCGPISQPLTAVVDRDPD